MTNLEQALTKALMEIIIEADLNDNITPETSLALIRPVAAFLENLPAQDQNTLTDLIMHCTAQETSPDRLVLALEIPDILGLSS
jgi:hypothetical protein